MASESRRGSGDATNRLDLLADALRKKDAEQRRTDVIDWRYLTQIDRTKWRELALVATVHLSKVEAP